MGIDWKAQTFIGKVNPVKADFRKSTGSFVGSPDDNHQTLFEVRLTDEDLERMGMTTEDVIELSEKANMLMALKFATPDEVVELVGAQFGTLLFHVSAGFGFRVYDED